MARPADPNARNALIAAARVELAKHGVKGARVEDITAACGLSKGAFYLHFASKEALLRELALGFIEQLQAGNAARIEATREFLTARGAITAADVSRRTKKYEALLALEAESDQRALELMWEHRDVFSILLRGAQGTEFADTIWEILDRETERVIEGFRAMQAFSALSGDVPVELLGTMVVGAYFLIGTRMMRATEKPDLALMARSLHQLIREGTLPHAAAAGGKVPRAARKPVSRRGRTQGNRSRR